jgi:enamine deaminase RidA (YjgF/YER057c/UK114 family)
MHNFSFSKCPFHNFVILGVPMALIFLWNIRKNNRKKIHRFDIDGRFSDAIRYGPLVFISGQVGGGETAEIATENALASVDAALSKAGTDKSRVVECTIWLADLADYDGMNKIYDKWIIPGQPPCRACVQAKLASPEWRVEIRVIAAKS